MPVNILVRDEPSSLAEVRAAVDTIPAEHGLSAEPSFDLKVARGEALANALRRARNNEVAVDVTLESDRDVIGVEVVDGGRFRIDEGPDPEHGRGLPLMIARADEVEFASSRDGTRVRIRMRVGRDDPVADL
ncbi:MAG: ATP-binding protein [Actinomycetota bacterium]|nr:ATP-binding protein [Actinomycetota bacterium]